jgi:hypothetical protein
MDRQDLADGGNDRPATTDWDRYGLARRAAGGPAELPSNRPTVRRGSESHDDVYLEYRQENLARSRSGGHPSARSRANMLAALSVGAAAILVIAVAYATSPTPSPTPTPTPTPAPTAAGPSPSTGPAGATEPPIPATNVATEVVRMVVPASVAPPDRAYQPDDGATMFLAGQSSGIAIDPWTGSTGTVFKGKPFSGLVRRFFVAGGNVWMSSGPTDPYCDVSCWKTSTTYRLNVGTGAVEQTYAATYLVGWSNEGLWLATKGRVDVVDPATGEVGSSVPWSAPGEPRVGCERLWSFDGTNLSAIDVQAGTVVATSVMSGTYGPFAAAGGCWMMTGQAGVSVGTTSLAQINDAGLLSSVTTSESTTILLDGELWDYSAGGKMQRLRPISGPYGPTYEFLSPPPEDDPTLVFASMGMVWVLDPSSGDLVGYDIHTGSGN